MKRDIIRYTQNLDVGSNEYATKYSINRILEKLIQNDKLLEEFYQEVFGSFMIYEYQPGETYYYNDLIWFLDSEKNLHILRCNKSQTNENLANWSFGQPFEKYGWKDLNPDIDIFKEFGFEKKISNWISKKFKEHTDNLDYHPLGKISFGNTKPTSDIMTKISNREMSNLDPNRNQNFFPYQTIHLKTSENGPIIGGYCRKYDNGLLEYDIVFRLSYLGIREIDEDYKISADILECNKLDLAKYHLDEDYFYGSGDSQIFNQESNLCSQFESEIGETRQRFRNDYVNVYSAVINFAQATSTLDSPSLKFKSKDSYMIFSGDVTCQIRDTKTHSMNIGSNQMVFVSKQAGSFVAILVTYPNQNFNTSGYNAKNGGIEANSFHCSLVGRWK